MSEPIHAAKGWFVSHLFYEIDRLAWAESDPSARGETGRFLSEWMKPYEEGVRRQLFTYSIWGLKADLGFLIVDPDLQSLDEQEKKVHQVFPSGVLQPVHSFISLSEASEYITRDDDYRETLIRQGVGEESPEFEKKMSDFHSRMGVYIEERLHPRIPPHRVMCFYPMNKTRRGEENWYRLDFETRKKYMRGHAATGRSYHEHVKQLVTGSIGLDDWEWGVTLFSDDPFYFKKIVYEMRYDEASARFGEFGDFWIGIQLAPQELINRLQLEP